MISRNQVVTADIPTLYYCSVTSTLTATRAAALARRRGPDDVAALNPTAVPGSARALFTYID